MDEATIAKAIDGTYPVPHLAGVHGRMRFIGPLATRDLVIDDGKVTITPEQKGAVDCTITCIEPGDNLRLIRGELQLVTSLLQGRVQAEGDPMLMVRIAGSMQELGRELPMPTSS
jgi:hypothetical protein